MTTPQTAAGRALLFHEDEARIRRNVAEIRNAEWSDDPDTEYHPDSLCQSDRDLVALLAMFDRGQAEARAAALDEARAAVLAQQPTPFAVLGGWDYRVASAAAIDALRERS